MACRRGRGSGRSGLGVAEALLEEVAVDPTTEPPELTQDWETDSWWHKQNLVCTRTQETGAVTPRETDPGSPVSVQASLAEAWVSGLLQGLGHRVRQCVHKTI